MICLSIIIWYNFLYFLFAELALKGKPKKKKIIPFLAQETFVYLSKSVFSILTNSLVSNQTPEFTVLLYNKLLELSQLC